MANQAGAEAGATVIWMHRNCVEPATMAVVARHRCSNHCSRVFGNEKEAVVCVKLLCYGEGWFVVRGFVAEHCAPQGDDLLPVGGIAVFTEVQHGQNRVWSNV